MEVDKAVEIIEGTEVEQERELLEAMDIEQGMKVVEAMVVKEGTEVEESMEVLEDLMEETILVVNNPSQNLSTELVKGIYSFFSSYETKYVKCLSIS